MLWSTIILTPYTRYRYDQTSFFISHSATSLLRLHYGRLQGAPPLLSQYANRLRELRVRFDGYYVPALVTLTVPAPNLEYLDIIIFDTNKAPEVPENFNSQYPRLQYLVLEGFKSLINIRVSNLTHLCVSGSNEGVSSSGDYPKFLQLLQSSPHLEVLVVRSPHPWIPWVSYENVTDTVMFRSLKKLCLTKMTHDQAGRLLSNLAIPRGVCMSFDLFDLYRYDKSLSFFEGNLTNLSSLDEITSLEVHIVNPALPEIIFNAAGPSGSFHTRVKAGTRLGHLQISSLQSLPVFLNNLKELHLFVSHSFVEPYRHAIQEDWDFITTLKSLEKLVVTTRVLATSLYLVSTLTPRHASSPRHPSSPAQPPTSSADLNHGIPIVCPKLQILWMSNEPRSLSATLEPLLSCVKSREGFLRERTLREIRLKAICSEDKSTATSPSVVADAAGRIASLRKYVDIVEYVEEFPSDGIDLPDWSEVTIRRGGTVWKEKWRPDSEE